MDNQSANIILPPEQTTPPPLSPPENLKTPLLKSRRTLYLFIVLAILILSTVILIILDHREIQRTEPLPEDTTPLTSQPPATDPTADWKTYTSDNYHFSIKYPPHLNLIEENQGNNIRFYKFGNGTEPLFLLGLTKNENNLTIQDFFEDLEKNNLGDPVSPFVQGEPEKLSLADNTEALLFRNIYCVTGCDKIFWKNDQYIFDLIKYHQRDPNNEHDSTYLQILATFRFLDQNDPNLTISWQIYTNTDHHLSFQYPLSWTLTYKPGETEQGIIYNSQIILTKNEAKITMYLNMDGIGGKPVNYEGSPFVLDRYSLYQYTLTNENNTEVVGLTDSLINSDGVFRIKDFIYMIRLEYPNSYDQAKETSLQNEFNQILSTFRFLD